MIYIERSFVVIFGHSVELYGFIAVIGAILITVINTLFAKKKAMNTSLSFRLTMLIIFGATAFHVFFQGIAPSPVLKISYALGVLILPFVFRIGGSVFGGDKREFTGLGIITALEYSVVTRLCCTFAGCCYGPAWSGFCSLVYGENTHNPLPGVSLFPLQPVMVLFLLTVAIFAIAVFLKNGSHTWMWCAVMLNLIAYYLNIFISPSSDGREIEALCCIVFFAVIACSLLLYYLTKKSKGVKENV